METASRADLAQRWRALYRGDPPKGVGRRFLIGAIAHELQVRESGRSVQRLRRRLCRLAAESDQPHRTAAPTLRPGARLLREWNGVTHAVDVGDDAYLWNGSRYRSLSAIARAITGTRWSGPRFFGLNQDAAP
jgi:hypothetical protein